MAHIKVVASGSSGNSYIIQAGGEILLLELGIRFKSILEALNWDISHVVGALVSHKHMDHAASVKNAREDYHIPVYFGEDISHGHTVSLGSFLVKALKVPHGDCLCHAFLIAHRDFGNLLFATDLSEFPYTVPRVNHMMLECNYDLEVITENAMDMRFSRSHSENHMSLETCIKTVGRMKSPHLQTLTLLHISNTNGDPGLFKERVFEYTGIQPMIASPGLEFDISPDEF